MDIFSFVDIFLFYFFLLKETSVSLSSLVITKSSRWSRKNQVIQDIIYTILVSKRKKRSRNKKKVFLKVLFISPTCRDIVLEIFVTIIFTHNTFLEIKKINDWTHYCT